MNQIPIVLTLIMLFFSPTVLLARLGETPDECTQRYGKPKKERTNILHLDKECDYIRGDNLYTIQFWKGKAARIYIKNKKGAISEIEIFKHLKENEFQNPTKTQVGDSWSSSNQKEAVLWYNPTPMLIVSTLEFDKAWGEYMKDGPGWRPYSQLPNDALQPTRTRGCAAVARRLS